VYMATTQASIPETAMNVMSGFPFVCFHDVGWMGTKKSEKVGNGPNITPQSKSKKQGEKENQDKSLCL